MNVGGAGVVGVADEEIDVADDRRLGGEVADVCRQIVCVFEIGVGVALELDGAVGARGEAFDEPLELFGADVAGRDGGVVGDGDVVEGGAGGVRRNGDEEGAVGSTLEGAAVVVEKEIARKAWCEFQRR